MVSGRLQARVCRAPRGVAPRAIVGSATGDEDCDVAGVVTAGRRDKADAAVLVFVAGFEVVHDPSRSFGRAHARLIHGYA